MRHRKKHNRTKQAREWLWSLEVEQGMACHNKEMAHLQLPDIFPPHQCKCLPIVYPEWMNKNREVW